MFIENKAVAFIIICLFLVIVFMPSLAFAQVPPTPKPQYATWDTERIARLDRDWQRTGDMLKDLEKIKQLPKTTTGSTSVYVGKKNVVINGEYKEVKSVAVIKPEPSRIAQFIKRLGLVGAVTTAVDMLSTGIDYVLDPANNRIQYKADIKKGEDGRYYAVGELLERARQICEKNGQPFTENGRIALGINSKAGHISIYCTPNNAPDVPVEKKSVPLEEVAQKIIDNADSDSGSNTSPTPNTKPNPVAVAATEFVAKAADEQHEERQKQYDDNSPIKPKIIPDDTANPDNSPSPSPTGGTGTGSSTSTDTKTDTATDNPKPNNGGQDNTANSPSFELPPFCSWATIVCEFIEWYKKEPELKDDEVPTKNIELKNPSEFDRDYVSVQAQCPADVVRDIPIGPNTFKLTFEMSPICDFASTYMRPVLIFMSYILGALMIGNAIRVD